MRYTSNYLTTLSLSLDQSARTVEYTDLISAEELNSPRNVLDMTQNNLMASLQ